MEDNASYNPKLVVLGGPMDGQEFALDKPVVIIGRQEDRDICLGWDGWVSRRHACITCRAGLYWLQDEGSTNGTFIIEAGGEEHRLEPDEQVLLSDGTLLRIGRALLKVEGILPMNDAIRWAYGQLKRSIEDLRAGQADLSPDDRERLRQHVGDFIGRLQSAANVEQVIQIAQEGIPTVPEGAKAEAEVAPPPQAEEWKPPSIPPLDLPPQDDPNRPPSILNLFLDDAKKLYDELGGTPDDKGV